MGVNMRSNSHVLKNRGANMKLTVVLFLLYFSTSYADIYSKGLLDFTLKIFKKLCDNNENVIFGTETFAKQMSIIYEATAGSTRHEMSHILHLNESLKDIVKDTFNNIERQFASTQLKSGVRLYLGDKFKLEKNFNITLWNSYSAEAERVNFSDPEQAVKTMNTWASEVTNGTVQSIMSREDIAEGATSAVLISVLYFKGAWKFPFASTATRTQNFTLTSGRVIGVPMMTVTEEFEMLTSDSLQCKFLKLPYKESNVSMLIAVPVNNNTVDQLLGMFEQWPSKDMFSNFQKREIEVFLPKFVVENEIELTSVLKESGMQQIFSFGADFTNMTPDVPFNIDKMKLKSRIEVDERGSVASAAEVSYFSWKMDNTVFKVDRPFLFMIYEESTHFPLFLGRIQEPFS